MSNEKKEFFKNKVEYLKEVCEGGNIKYIDVYYIRVPNLMLSPNEALKLYKEKRDVGIPKSVIYFFLSDEDKIRYVGDVVDYKEKLENFQ